MILFGAAIGVVFFIIPGLIVWIFGIYDAYATAHKMNKGEIPFKPTIPAHLILFFVLAIFLFIIVIILLTIIVFAAFFSLLFASLH